MTCWNLSYMPFDILKATDFLMAGNGLSLGFAQWLITSHILFVAPPLSSQEISLYSAEKGQSVTDCSVVWQLEDRVWRFYCDWNVPLTVILRTWLYRTRASANTHDVNKYLVIVVVLRLRLDALALCTASSLLKWRLAIPHRVEALSIW